MKRVIISCVAIALIFLLNINVKVLANDTSLFTAGITGEDTNASIQILRAQIRLLEEALEEMTPCSPEETALIWAKGVKSRNGAIEYSVLSPKLKEEFRKNIGNELWVTGVSSPWVENYKIIKKETVKPSDYKITVQLNYATSTGPAGKSDAILTIAKEENKWRVTDLSIK